METDRTREEGDEPTGETSDGPSTEDCQNSSSAYTEPTTGPTPREAEGQPSQHAPEDATPSDPPDSTSDSPAEAALAEQHDQVEDQTADPKRSPAEAFAELAAEVRAVRTSIIETDVFVRTCREKLLHEADVYRAEGQHDVLQSLVRVYDAVFQRVTAMEAGNERPDRFTIDLFGVVEAELKSHHVEVVRPQPGDEVDLALMTAIGTVRCPFWRRPDRVAQVARCGLIYRGNISHRNSRKAEVTVYRRETED